MTEPWKKYATVEEKPSNAPWERYAPDAHAEPRESLGMTLFEQGMQGATFGFADEISDRLGAAGAALLTGESYGDMLKQAREMTSERQARQWRQNPKTAIAGNIVGGLLTGGAGATTKAGAALGNIVRSGNTTARIAKGAAYGAASGGLYGYGSGDDGERADSALRGAVLGAAGGGAVPAISAGASGLVKGTKNIAKGMFAKSVDALDDVERGIRETGSRSFERMRANGATFTPQTNQKIVTDVAAKLQGDGILNSGLHGKTMSVVDDLQNAMQKEIGLEELHQYRQLFGQIASNRTPDNLQDARKASLVIDALDDAILSLKPTDLKAGSIDAVSNLKSGMADWARLKKYQTIADVVRKSDGDANYLKRELKKILDNPKKHRGFTKDELAALQEASTLSFGEGVMKMAGKFGIDFGNSRIGNGVAPIVGGLTTAMASNPIAGAAVPAVGTVARYGQKALARGKAETLLNVIEQGGKVTQKQVLSLPPGEFKKFVNTLGPAQSSAIFGARSSVPIVYQ